MSNFSIEDIFHLIRYSIIYNTYARNLIEECNRLRMKEESNFNIYVDLELPIYEELPDFDKCYTYSFLIENKKRALIVIFEKDDLILEVVLQIFYPPPQNFYEKYFFHYGRFIYLCV